MLCAISSILCALCSMLCAMCGMLCPPMRAFLPDTLLLTAPITSSPNHHLHNHCNHHNTNQLKIINIALNCRSLHCNREHSAVFREHWDLWQVDRSVLSPPAVRGWLVGGGETVIWGWQDIKVLLLMKSFLLTFLAEVEGVECWYEEKGNGVLQWSKYWGRVWRNTNGKIWEIQKRRCRKYKCCGTRLTMVGRTKTDCRSLSPSPTHWFCH